MAYSQAKYLCHYYIDKLFNIYTNIIAGANGKKLSSTHALRRYMSNGREWCGKLQLLYQYNYGDKRTLAP